MLLLSPELRESIAEMKRKGSKRKCRFMQIKAFIQLLFFDVKLPLLEQKREKNDNCNHRYINNVKTKMNGVN